MIGILVGVIISWGILYLVEKQSILALGILPPLKRGKQFAIGFLIAAILCMGVQFLEALLSSSSFHLSENVSAGLILNMLRWDAISVLTEELIFRGALLYILIEKLGVKRGVIISAISFGIYHWFSYGLLGNLVPMIVIFVGTGLMGYAWALAFVKTRSILMPFGLHLGWNFTFNTIFSKGPLGDGLLISEGGTAISDWFSLVGLWLIPVVLIGVIIYFIPEESAE